MIDKDIVAQTSLSKDGFALVAHRLTQAVRDGEQTELDAYIRFKALEEIAKDGQALVKDVAIDQASQNEREEFFGVIVGTTRTAGKWEFKHDPEWVKLNNDLLKAKAKLKAYENLMKTIEEPMANTVTGEMVHPAEEIKQQGTTLKIAFPKGTH